MTLSAFLALCLWPAGGTAEVRGLAERAEAALALGAPEEAAARLAELLETVPGLTEPERSAAAPEAALALHRLGEITATRGGARAAAETLRRFSEPFPGVPPSLTALARYLSGMALLDATGDPDRAREVWEPLGFLEKWWIAGPFDNERGGGFLTACGPERGFDLEATYEGKQRTVRWRRLPARPLGGIVDLDALMDPRDETLAYALTFIHSDSAPEVVLGLGSDEGYRVWLNGKLAASADLHRPLRFDQTAIRLQLAPGWNSLLLKIPEATGAWELQARLSGLEGSALEGVREGDPPAAEVARLSALQAAADAGGPARLEEAEIPDPLEEALRRRLAEDPAGARAHYLLGALLRRRHPFDAGEHPDRDLLARAATIDSRPPIYHLELAATHEWRSEIEAQRDDNDWREALERAAAAGSAFASYRLARHRHEAFGSTSRAREHLARALEGNPELAEALLLRGEVEAALGYPGAQRRALREAVRRAPGSRPVLLARARDLAARGRVGEAESILRGLLEGRRLDREGRAELVAVLLGAGRREEAEELLVEHGRLEPFATEPHERLAGIALGRDEPERAAEHYARALAIRPDDPDLLEKQGEAYLEAEMRAEALGAWRRALGLRPGAPRLRRRIEFLEEAGPELEEEFARDGTAVAAEAQAEGADAAAGDPARVLLDLRAIQVSPDGTTRAFSQRLVEILSDLGVRQHDRFSVAYAAGDQVLQFRRARVIHADGTTSAARLSRFEEERLGGAPSHWRRGSIDLPPLRPGDVVEVQYVLEDVARSFFGDLFGHRELFQEEVPVREKTFILRVPAGRKFHFHERDLGVEPEKVTSGDGAHITYRWTLRGIEKLRPEVASPPPDEISPALEVSTFEDWAELTRWYWNLIKRQFESSPEIAAKVRELTSGLETDRQRLEAIYRFVAGGIQYNAWEFGVHGFKPYKAATVFARRFGDCKDKAALLCVMLAEAGIDAHPVLIRAVERRPREDLALPMVHHFNHAITYVPGPPPEPGLFLDSTASFHGSRDLPAMDRGARVLVVRPGGGEILQVPWNRPGELSVEEERTVTLVPRGESEVRLLLQATGDFAALLRRAFEIEAQRQAALEKLFARRFAGAKVTEQTFSDLRRLEEPVRLAVTLSVPDLLEEAPEGWTLTVPEDLFATESDLEGLGAEERRTQDVLLGAPRRSRLQVTYVLPAGWKVRSLPEAREISAPFGRFVLEAAAEGPDRIRLERTVTLTEPRVPVGDYPRLRELTAAVESLRNERIVLEEGAP